MTICHLDKKEPRKARINVYDCGEYCFRQYS